MSAQGCFNPGLSRTNIKTLKVFDAIGTPSEFKKGVMMITQG
jgi:hypothetical protein